MNSNSIIPINSEYEKIFQEQMITWECGLIALDMEQEFDDLKNGCELGLYEVSVKLFLSMTLIMCKHFIQDEHWRWFDDLYEPEFVVMRMYHYLDHLRGEGMMPEDVCRILDEGWKEILNTECCREYGLLRGMDD